MARPKKELQTDNINPIDQLYICCDVGEQYPIRFVKPHDVLHISQQRARSLLVELLSLRPDVRLEMTNEMTKSFDSWRSVENDLRARSVSL